MISSSASEADRRLEERRSRRVNPPTLADIETTYRVLGEQHAYGTFVETLVERTAELFKARACAFADARTFVTWRFDVDAFDVVEDQAITVNPETYGLTLGLTGDLDAPFSDAEGSYVLLALDRGDERFGWLYLFNPAAMGPEEQLRLTALGSYVAVTLQNIRLVEDAERLAFTDALTGIPNRRALQIEVENRCAQGDAFAYLMMDLDHFKAINDSLGHDGGDQALRVFAEAMQAAARRGDFVARFAGDEFVALLEGESPAAPFVDRLRGGLTMHRLSTSVGCAMFPTDARGQVELHKVADDRMFEAKRSKPSRR